MKSPITWLPTLMLLGLMGGYRAHPSPAMTPGERANRAAEARSLQEQMKTLAARLASLEVDDHPFVPRGGLGPTEPRGN